MVAVTRENLLTSLGALTIGGLTATALSGVVMMQTILYFRLYENDQPILKLVVAVIFLLDIFHTCMVWGADWMYLVQSFGDMNITDHVFWTAGVRLVSLICAFRSNIQVSHSAYYCIDGNYDVLRTSILLVSTFQAQQGQLLYHRAFSVIGYCSCCICHRHIG